MADNLLEKFKQRTMDYLNSEIERFRFNECEKVMLVTSEGVKESGLFKETASYSGLSVYETVIGKTKVKIVDLSEEELNPVSRCSYEQLKKNAKAHIVFDTKEEFGKKLRDLI